MPQRDTRIPLARFAVVALLVADSVVEAGFVADPRDRAFVADGGAGYRPLRGFLVLSVGVQAECQVDLDGGMETCPVGAVWAGSSVAPAG
ncbi:hypothetical protein GCM10020219_080000 [Nonomuraea dietziae]